jgi:protein-tyrosine-phosphatase/predicted ATP-grasp superfamily ATP-dependent carboligase
VLVLGSDTRSFLSVVRSLGRAGLEVDAAWCPPEAPAAKSRYLRKLHTLPPLSHEDLVWLDALIELIRAEHYDLVIPCHDAECVMLQPHRARLEAAGRVYLLDDNTFRVSYSKYRTRSLAASLGVPVPEERTVTSVSDVAELGELWGYPLVVKPAQSVFPDNPNVKQTVKKIWSRDEIAFALDGCFSMSAGVQVQKNIRGIGVGVNTICKQGRILAAMQHERVHEPPLGGGSSYRRTVPLHPGMLEATNRILAALDYTGVAMLEFKLDPKTAEWVLIEINGRFWGSLPLSIAAGMDFPRYLYEMLVNGETAPPQNYRLNLYSRNWLADLAWMKDNFKADHSNPALITVPFGKVLREFGNIAIDRERSDTFVLDDPNPAWCEFGGQVHSRISRLLKRVLSKFPRYRGMRANSARFALRKARSVLFVCRGNICRSPFAAKVLNELRPEIESLSAGFIAVQGRQSPASAVEAAAKFNIDLRDHRSSVITRDKVASADVVFVFDVLNEADFAREFPEFVGKLHYLGALDTRGNVEIHDPFGATPEKFSTTYQRILDVLTDAVQTMPKEAKRITIEMGSR